MKACLNKSRQVITINLIDTVLEGDHRSYFTCGYEEHLLLPVIYTYIYLRAFQHLLIMVSKNSLENSQTKYAICTGLSFVIRFHNNLTNRTSKTAKND